MHAHSAHIISCTHARGTHCHSLRKSPGNNSIWTELTLLKDWEAGIIISCMSVGLARPCACGKATKMMDAQLNVDVKPVRGTQSIIHIVRVPGKNGNKPTAPVQRGQTKTRRAKSNLKTRCCKKKNARIYALLIATECFDRVDYFNYCFSHSLKRRGIWPHVVGLVFKYQFLL